MQRYVFLIDGRAIQERRSPIILIDTQKSMALRCHGLVVDQATLYQGTLQWKMGTWHVWGMAEKILSIQKKSSVRTSRGTYTASGPQKEAYAPISIKEVDSSFATLSTQFTPAQDTSLLLHTSDTKNYEYQNGKKDLGLWICAQVPPSEGGVPTFTTKRVTCLGPVSLVSNLLASILPSGPHVVMKTESPVYYYDYKNSEENNRASSSWSGSWPDQLYLGQAEIRPTASKESAFFQPSQGEPSLPSLYQGANRSFAQRSMPQSEILQLIEKMVPKQSRILDFGAAEGGAWCNALRSMGYDAQAFHPSMSSPSVLNQSYDVVYASNLLGRAPSPQAMSFVVDSAYGMLGDGGVFIADYPNKPIPTPLMMNALGRHFGPNVMMIPSSQSSSILLANKSNKRLNNPSSESFLGALEESFREMNPSAPREENPSPDEINARPRSQFPFMTRVDIRQRLSMDGARTRQKDAMRSAEVMRGIPFQQVLRILSSPWNYSRPDLMSFYRYVLGGCKGTPNEIRKGTYTREVIYGLITEAFVLGRGPNVAPVFVGDEGEKNWEEASKVWEQTIGAMR